VSDARCGSCRREAIAYHRAPQPLPVRQFLYISPFFPPMTRVGALRPLKFARHLPDFGWSPVVLCQEAEPGQADPRLAAAAPASTVVIPGYSRRRASAASTAPPVTPAVADTRAESPASGAGSRSRLPWQAEDINPLGAHAFGIPHALRAARAALAAHPGCEAIMVNADPYAAMLVGARLARETGLPLIQDLRDPWSVCELRRPLRPKPMRALVDTLERRAVEAAAAVILNTRTAQADYRRHYADLPSARFHAIPNHTDVDLLALDPPPPGSAFDRFTILFLGNFRRFVEGAVVLEALARVRDAGVGADRLQLVVTGTIPAELWARAAQEGVRELVQAHPFVPYLDVGEIMARADLLLSFSHATAQRIPAKVYDYLISDRPLLVLADNPELRELVERAGGASVHGLAEVDAIAAAILAAHGAGRHQQIARAEVGIDSRTASRTLAAILDRAVAEAPGRRVGERRSPW
jgi:glycosyltransferase involved in cell wall biosynthesis